MTKTTPVTADDVDRTLALAEQFICEWKESDAEQPELDRDASLPRCERDFERLRPLLLAAPQLADLATRMLALLPESETALREEAASLLCSITRSLMADGSAESSERMEISEDTWRAVLCDGLEVGAIWRPSVVVEGPEVDRKGYYWRDTKCDDPEAGPFATFYACIRDVLKHSIIDAFRLTRHCGLDRATADAVLL